MYQGQNNRINEVIQANNPQNDDQMDGESHSNHSESYTSNQTNSSLGQSFI